MKLTAKDAAERLGVSYVVAAGLMSHLEDTGKAKVVEKRFHSSGKGKPTRVYEVDQHTVIDFGAEVVTPVVAMLDEILHTEPLPAEVMAAVVAGVVQNAAEKLEEMGSDSEIVVATSEPNDHIAAALARLKEQNNF